LEAVQRASDLAIQYQNQRLDQEHLLFALLAEPQELIPQLLIKMNLNSDAIQNELSTMIAQLPKVTGAGREADKIYISPETDQALNRAEEVRREHEGRVCLCRTPLFGADGLPE